jgi:hypothetical protein
MVGSATRSAVTAPSAQEVGTFRRVIGRDGVERDIVNRADWMAAIQSNAVDEGCLFFDPKAQRWRPLSELDLYSSAVSAITTAAGPGKNSGSETHVSPGSGSRTFSFAYSFALWSVLVAIGAIAFLTWTSGLKLTALQIPFFVLIAGMMLVTILLGQEFHWFALRLLGVTDTRLAQRLGAQLGSLLTTAFLSYLALGPISLKTPEAVLVTFVKNVALIGGIYAPALLLWSLIMLRRGSLAKKTLASVLAAAMLIGTLYMGLTPLTR